MADINYLDEERIKLWDEVNRLKEAINEISKITPEEIKESKQFSKEVSTYRNRILEKDTEITNIHNNLASKLTEIDTKTKVIDTYINDLKTNYEQIQEQSDEISDIHNEVTTSIEEYRQGKTTIDTGIKDCTALLTQAKSINEKMQEQNTNSSSYESKIISLYKKTLETFIEIQKLHNEIFGYDEEDDDEETTKHINGLKEELDATYTKLNTAFSDLENEFNNLKKVKFEEIDSDYSIKEKKYNELKAKIESLLPGAMSAGLSSSYHEKKEDEIKEKEKSEKIFYIALSVLTTISLIPFGLGIFLLCSGKFDLQTLILDTPRIVCATLPLYAPALWLAYSSNRKSNLSKRLIEEYTHKETLSKTFEGLSKQIEGLDDDEISNELKVKLLYNIVSMNSENPGALIKGYNKSDHPFMDIIDKSTNLTNALEKLSHLPGIRSIASSILDKISVHQEEKISTGLKANSELSKN